jgi:cell division protein FtsA
MGGGTTTLSVFVDGHMVHLDAIAVGGNHVTMDIARAFATRLQDAERLKTLYGSPLASGSDDRDCSRCRRWKATATCRTRSRARR